MDEYAIVFFLLVKRSREIDSSNMLDDIIVVSSPMMKDAERKRLIRKIESATGETKYATIEEIRRDRKELKRRLKGGLL